SVAAGHRAGVEPQLAARGVPEDDIGALGAQVVQPHVGDLVVDLLAGRVPGPSQILLHLGLPVDPHPAADQVDEIQMVAFPRPLPWAATCSAATRRGRSRFRLGTTMPSAATTLPSAARTGTATENAPRLISSWVSAKPSRRTRRNWARSRPGWVTVNGVTRVR